MPLCHRGFPSSFLCLSVKQGSVNTYIHGHWVTHTAEPQSDEENLLASAHEYSTHIGKFLNFRYTVLVVKTRTQRTLAWATSK